MKKRILLLSAYHAESHKHWAETLMQMLAEFDWQLLSLPPRYFSWRIRGNSLSFLADYADVLAQPWDLLVCTSMVDLATLKSVVPGLSAVPSICYFHENQFAYPVNDNQHRSLEPKMVNLYSAMAAEKVVFNSCFNRDSFLDGVTDLLQRMPDKTPQGLADGLRDKSSVIPVPIVKPDRQSENLSELQALDVRPRCEVAGDAELNPQLLWNHRWEYDKNPELLLAILQELDKRQIVLQIAIVGQQFRHTPAAFEHIHQLLQSSESLTLVNWGYLTERKQYQACLKASAIVLSTALHDFQGLAILEAVQAGALPVLPNHQVYPEWFDERLLYAVEASLQQQAENAVDIIEAIVLHQLSVDSDLAFLSTEVLAADYRQLITTMLY